MWLRPELSPSIRTFLDRIHIKRTSSADVLYPVRFPGFSLSLLTPGMAKTNKLSFTQQSAFDGVDGRPPKQWFSAFQLISSSNWLCLLPSQDLLTINLARKRCIKFSIKEVPRR